MVKGKFYRIDEKTGEHQENRWNNFFGFTENDFERIVSFEEEANKLLKVDVVPWNGIYRREFLKENGIRFNSLVCVNDRSFFISVCIHSKRTVFVEDWIVYHRVNIGTSLVGQRAKHFECHFASYWIISKQCEHLPPEIQAAIQYVELKDIFAWYRKFRTSEYGESITAQMKEFLADVDIGNILKYCDQIVWLQTWAQLLDKEINGLISEESFRNEKKVKEELKKELKASNAELNRIRCSRSYRIGRAVTFIPRKLRGGFRCYQQHGMKYTLVRLLIHLHIINDTKKKNLDQSFTLERVMVSLKKKVFEIQLQKKVVEEIPTVVRDYDYYNSLSPDQYEDELRIWYKEKKKENLDLENPRTFNEKIQWIKLYDNTPLKTKLADKFLVREWVEEKLGRNYLIPLLGVWNSFDEIDFDELPNQFVLKCNHASGWNIIVKDKNSLNKQEAKEKFDMWINKNFAFAFGFQLHYMNIPRRIVAEKYMADLDGDIYDYRFFCFDGEPKYVWVDIGSGTRDHKRNIYDMEWNLQSYKVNYPLIEPAPQKPTTFEEMIHCAKILSEGFSLVRVDFYSVDNRVYFGEMTFTPQSGTGKWDNYEQNLMYGDLITLPEKKPYPKRMF